MQNSDKRIFWFDDNKTPNAADILAKEKDFVVHRLNFHGPESENWGGDGNVPRLLYYICPR